ncbi:MAG: polysaccharide biosynthesis protein [Desulfuromonadales bacterium]|nr:MAG: polysaccharide biosynthesis protein [Desulfuromonadales bacterium]
MVIAFTLSFLLRFDFRIPPEMEEIFRKGLLIIVLTKPLVFLTSGLYRSLWRYASLQDGIEIFKIVTLSSIISVFTLSYIRHFSPLPRSIFLLDWLLLFSMIAASRLIWRVYRETYIIPSLSEGHRTLIVGAGHAASLLLKEIRRQPHSLYHVVGLVDDSSEKQGMRLHGIPVVGTTHNLSVLVRDHNVEDVIIANPSISGKGVREIVKACEHCNVRFKILPSIRDLIGGDITVSQIKDVDIEDLLGRETVTLDEQAIGAYLTGKRVLVTGAAGSIGSEICRQVARFKPAKVVLFDAAETPLFFLEKELMESHPNLRLIPVIGDIRNQERVEMVFDEFMPEVVFHAAAYKHVPMMEYNPVEAVSNNIGGTKVIADTAHRFSVRNFVMISTDKAVNPTNIMGATKRVAEMYVQALARSSSTKFTTVRFGNVLGSNGSVIPIFKEQILSGGPVTVTDPEVVRYFMTIPEASQLVLQAGCIGKGGEIFVLDMGEPVRIVELAEELIRLSGFTPYEDIDIVFTGLRPGEKLFEELLIEGEGIKHTSHDKIKVADAVESDAATIGDQLDVLFSRARMSDISGIMASLQEMVVEYRPSYQFSDEPSPGFRRVRPDLFPHEQTLH